MPLESGAVESGFTYRHLGLHISKGISRSTQGKAALVSSQKVEKVLDLHSTAEIAPQYSLYTLEVSPPGLETIS